MEEFLSIHFNPFLLISVLISDLFEVPLELESPTQISLVDEASGEVKSLNFSHVHHFIYKSDAELSLFLVVLLYFCVTFIALRLLLSGPCCLFVRRKILWSRCSLRVTVLALSCESNPPRTPEFMRHHKIQTVRMWCSRCYNLAIQSLNLFLAVLQVPVWRLSGKCVVHGRLQVLHWRRVQDRTSALGQQVVSLRAF